MSLIAEFRVNQLQPDCGTQLERSLAFSARPQPSHLHTYSPDPVRNSLSHLLHTRCRALCHLSLLQSWERCSLQYSPRQLQSQSSILLNVSLWYVCYPSWYLSIYSTVYPLIRVCLNVNKIAAACILCTSPALYFLFVYTTVAVMPDCIRNCQQQGPENFLVWLHQRADTLTVANFSECDRISSVWEDFCSMPGLGLGTNLGVGRSYLVNCQAMKWHKRKWSRTPKAGVKNMISLDSLHSPRENVLLILDS